MTQHTRNFSFKVLTINTHKGFTAFNKRFILPELRDAVRTVGADIVCLQEVMGAHEVHPLHIENWPDTTHYEFWPTPCGAISPMAAMRSIRKAITVTRFFLAIPLNIMKIATSRSAVAKTRRALLPHYAAHAQPPYPRHVRTSRPAGEPPPGTVNHAGGMGECLAGIRTGAGGRRL